MLDMFQVMSTKIINLAVNGVPLNVIPPPPRLDFLMERYCITMVRPICYWSGTDILYS